MNKLKTIPFRYVFYKIDDTPGQLVAFFTGSDKEILEKIKVYSWKEFKVFEEEVLMLNSKTHLLIPFFISQNQI